MCRRLIELLREIEMDHRLSDGRQQWLKPLGDMPNDLVLTLQFAIAEGRKRLYAAHGCAHIPNVDLLYVSGYHILQYPTKQLVIQTAKGKLHCPSPFGGTLIPREPVWRKIKPQMTVY